MKKKLVAILLLFFFALTALTVQAASITVEKYDFKLTELEFLWVDQTPDEFGTPEASFILIEKDQLVPDRMRIRYTREYYDGEIYAGSYYFSALIPLDTLDLRKRFDEPIDLVLELDGWGMFYSATDKEEEEPWTSEPEPFNAHLSLTIHIEPSDDMKVMMNSKSRQGAIKSNEMIRGHITDLKVTGTINGTEFLSESGSLRMLVLKSMLIGQSEEEPPFEKTEAAAPGSSAKGKPVMQNFNQILMDVFADRMDEDIIKEQRVMMYLMDSTLEAASEFYSYDPLEEVEIIEYFRGVIEDYTWDPADYSDGQYEISVEVEGELTRIIFRWREGTEEVTTEEVTRLITLTFDMTQSGTNRTIINVAGQDYAVKEHSSTVDFSGDATIMIDNSDPASARGYASIRRSKVRMFGEAPL